MVNRYEVWLEKQLQEYARFLINGSFLTGALEWYHSMKSSYNIHPNFYSFFLFLSFYLTVKSIPECTRLINEMETIGIDLSELLNDFTFQSNDNLNDLKSFLGLIGKPIQETDSRDILDNDGDLLSSVMQDYKDLNDNEQEQKAETLQD